ncbi:MULTISPECIES: type II toxin-antitoxin system PemK/MazF family toxin [Pediococcus]|jgi:mRNA interferase MazF|uniref:Type II toxin-antitoxin system PemK/MazF family toxin n=1 Tax=Pediococcus parvulus TaxID=54062 RepID=A0AAP5TBE4_9LACO|nr:MULTISPECIES: type II toxin-antitoxin system PemK/MazF family toxin [Pediococcus]MCT3028773.1 type II toxin-antitoxin system PemK/MazF family toxin [Pediococcus parvulus]MCT3035387.1 type II toxin-antitoxin system PemK/MazF family toxin [Pediococcus parvulus]MDV7693916.1 type II toxin-antitoxin system PemK/MazF family toxin [Pediococcus parvulus]OAD63930.1 hypothetical protein A7K95_07115 [Pediococcus parvulus]HBO47350.1 type II toxin-antitoxin system PemK/MazF family toxin [Pediococcus sp.
MNDYPHYQDIIYLNFDPSPGNEVNKRRLAVVISITEYNRLTGLCVVCPITHTKHRFGSVKVHHSKIDGYVNAWQMYSFDYFKRQMERVGELSTADFNLVIQNYQQILGNGVNM